MSMVMEKVAHINAPNTESAPPASKRGKRYRPHKARVSTKVRWALEDCMERTVAAQRRMKRLFDSFEEMRQAALTGKDVRMEMGQVEHELFGLALDVAELERILTATVAETKPESASAKANMASGPHANKI